ncbi:MAG: hypothetical protein WC910_10945 [Bacteroidales bacterium]|jgi:hypothetical protein
MDSRDIIRIEKSIGLNMFVLRSGGVINASDIAVSLYSEVQALRYYGNKDCTAMTDEALDLVRGRG